MDSAICKKSITREVLIACTDEWADEAPSPLEAVLEFNKKLGSVANTYSTYLSTAITSSGYARDESLTKVEAINKNAETALLMAEHLDDKHLIVLDESIDATALGFVGNWQQDSYMRFWLPIITRPDLTPDNIRHIDQKMDNFANTHDMQTFGSSHAPQSARRKLYREFTKTYLGAIKDIPTHPIAQTIQLVDSHTSHGAYSESKATLEIGAQNMLITYGGTEQNFISSLDNLQLRQHLARLAELGSHFINTHKPYDHKLTLIAKR